VSKTVGNCTAQEWGLFWELRGWHYNGNENEYFRSIKGAGDRLNVIMEEYTTHRVAITWVRSMEDNLKEWPMDTPLQQIADELDELADTKIMRGWA